MNAPATITAPDRSRFLGGSDAAAVLGVSPYSTPVELWMEKTGRTPTLPPDPIQQKRFERGHKLEPFIREMVIDKLQALGLRVELVAINERYQDHEFPFLSCEVDFELRLWGVMEINGAEVVFDGEHINCDAKSVSGFTRKKWGDTDTEDVPIEYAAQFMHGLMVAPGRRQRCLVAALRSFDDVDIFWTLRDEETIAAMRPKLVSFWLDHVQADVAPDPHVFTDIKLLFPVDNGEAIEASDDIADKVKQLAEVKSRIKEFEEAEEALKFEIADFISPNTLLTLGGREIASWKGQNDTRLDMDAFKQAHPDLFAQFTRTKVIRVLRLKKGKK